MAGQGTDLASDTAPGARSRRRRSVARLVTPLGLLCACVIPPEVADPPPSLPSLVVIDKQKIDPPVLDEVKVFPKETLRNFSLRNAVTAQNPKGPLRYHWYLDYNPKAVGPVQLFAFCLPDPYCVISVCDLKKTTNDRHTVLAVVSDGPLVDDAVGPLEFPEGTAFDWVQWQFQLLQACDQ